MTHIFPNREKDETLIRKIRTLETRLEKSESRESPFGRSAGGKFYIPKWWYAVNYINSLPGLRGFWTGGRHAGHQGMQDLSGMNHSMNDTGTVLYDILENYGAELAYLNGTDAYFTSADNAEHSITGTESYIYTYPRGLTFGGWMRFNGALPGTDRDFIAKWNPTGAQRSYLLFYYTTPTPDRFVFNVSSNGTNIEGVYSPTEIGTIAFDTWYFVVGRFDPGVELAMFVNGYWRKLTGNGDFNGTAISGFTSLFDSTAALNIGTYDGSRFAKIHFSLVFLSAMRLPDWQVEHIYHASKDIFEKGTFSP